MIQDLLFIVNLKEGLAIPRPPNAEHLFSVRGDSKTGVSLTLQPDLVTVLKTPNGPFNMRKGWNIFPAVTQDIQVEQVIRSIQSSSGILGSIFLFRSDPSDGSYKPLGPDEFLQKDSGHYYWANVDKDINNIGNAPRAGTTTDIVLHEGWNAVRIPEAYNDLTVHQIAQKMGVQIAWSWDKDSQSFVTSEKAATGQVLLAYSEKQQTIFPG